MKIKKVKEGALLVYSYFEYPIVDIDKLYKARKGSIVQGSCIDRLPNLFILEEKGWEVSLGAISGGDFVLIDKDGVRIIWAIGDDGDRLYDVWWTYKKGKQSMLELFKKYLDDKTWLIDDVINMLCMWWQYDECLGGAIRYPEQIRHIEDMMNDLDGHSPMSTMFMLVEESKACADDLNNYVMDILDEIDSYKD